MKYKAIKQHMEKVHKKLGVGQDTKQDLLGFSKSRLGDGTFDLLDQDADPDGTTAAGSRQATAQAGLRHRQAMGPAARHRDRTNG